MFDLIHFNEIEMKGIIEDCQREGHVQQVAYSTYHSCLTQVCFICEAVRTSIKVNDLESAQNEPTIKDEMKREVDKGYAKSKEVVK